MNRIGTKDARDAPEGSFVMDMRGNVCVKGEDWLNADTGEFMGYLVRSTPFQIVGEEIFEEVPEDVFDYYGGYRSLMMPEG